MTTGSTAAGVASTALVGRAPDPLRVVEPMRRRECSDADRTTPPCRCGHAAEAHEHYRSGSDCGVCESQECGRFRPQRGRWWRRVFRRC